MQVLSIKENDKILIIAPHPDDECIGPGGIMALYPHLCRVIVLTDGRQGQGDIAPEIVKDIRKQEFMNEMQAANIADYSMMDYEDGSLMQHTDCLEDIDLTQYTKVFVTGIHDGHSDHAAACISLRQALTKQSVQDIEIYQYEVHSPLREVSHMLDITSVVDKKVSLIRCHQSQLTSLAYDEMAKTLARYRALQNRMCDCYIETYAIMSLTENMDNSLIEMQKNLQKSILFYWVLTRWMDLKIRGGSTAELLKKLGYSRIAVYGYAEMGQLLCRELKDTEVDVVYVIDKKVKDTKIKNLPIYFPQNDLPIVDVIVVTAIYYFDEIQKELLQMKCKNVVSLRTLLESNDMS